MNLGQKRPANKVFRPQEMTGRFGAKADFVNYFKVQRKYLQSASPSFNSLALCAARRYVEQRLLAIGLCRREEIAGSQCRTMGGGAQVR